MLPGESPVRYPEIPLNGGSVNTGSYEDCVWHIYLEGIYGIELLVDLWNYRRASRNLGKRCQISIAPTF